jgi:hypothetical protein
MVRDAASNGIDTVAQLGASIISNLLPNTSIVGFNYLGSTSMDDLVAALHADPAWETRAANVLAKTLQIGDIERHIGMRLFVNEVNLGTKRSMRNAVSKDAIIRHYQDLIDVNWDATKLSEERSLSGDLIRGFRKSSIGAVFFGKK